MRLEDIAFESEKFEANTQWCYDKHWEERDKDLPIGVRNRLAVVDRSIYASNAIARMLVADARGKEDAADDDRVIYKGLDACEVAALRLALIELGDRAEEMLTEVRENANSCCGARWHPA